MEHPLHDDSHLENHFYNDHNIDELTDVVVELLATDDLIGYATDVIKKEYSKDPIKFKNDWDTFMEER